MKIIVKDFMTAWTFGRSWYG